ncbi:MAG: DUF4384 domain-containing protein [Thermoguttaceae bacterium]
MGRLTSCAGGAVLAAVWGAGLGFGNPASAQQQARFRDLVDACFDEGKGEDIAKLIGYERPATQVVALQYKVLLYEKNGDKAAEKAVDPKTYPFKIGDRIRLTIEPYTDSYIYIFHVGASKKQVFLLPRKGKQPPNVPAKQQVALPKDGFFEFVEPPGDEKLLVVAAQMPVPDLNVLASVLSKYNDPNAKFTAEEEEVRKSLNATVEANLKSVQEREIEKRDQVVMFRGIGDPAQRKALAEDVQSRAPGSATLEIPGQKPNEGTLAVYISVRPDDQQGLPGSLLVTIPLKSGALVRTGAEQN